VLAPLRLLVYMSSSVRPPPSNELIKHDGLTEQLEAAWQIAFERLQAAQHAAGHWTGGLSTSALSTATAVSALVEARNHHCIATERGELVNEAVRVGCRWLQSHQNRDGGFGDTDRSQSNIATSLLVIAAWEMAGVHDAAFKQQSTVPLRRVWEYVDQAGRWQGLRDRYGKDKTFVVPILSNCALAGLVPWSEVSPLPFEAAWLPQDWYRWARMPVVSYAVPALVAIGQARFLKAPPRISLLKKLRRRALAPTLEVLRRMQPASGGYLEAVPLTSFVLMNLAAVGNGSLPVAQSCIRFILNSRLEDGSWPIDTNLSTWLTSLAIGGISQRQPLQVQMNPGQPAASQAAGPHRSAARHIDSDSCSTQTVRWLLRCQHKQRHPFTGANPGGWGWTDLSGAVPDADDTPAALLALNALKWDQPGLQRLQHEVESAAVDGLNWLVRLQNRDGGWPTFCRGWGKLPFDRSGTDLTAHALRAIHAWSNPLGKSSRPAAGAQPATPRELTLSVVVNANVLKRLAAATTRGLRFLARGQAADGSWLPLWFGNQDRPHEDNPVYGTGKVLMAYAALSLVESQPAQRGIDYLRNCQNPDGGWGGGPSVVYPSSNLGYDELTGAAQTSSSIEETAIALEGLLECGGDPLSDPTIMRGLGWLAVAVQQGGLEHPQPIGFYFAKLWYYEQLYPTVFSLGAIGAALRAIERGATEQVTTERVAAGLKNSSAR